MSADTFPVTLAFPDGHAVQAQGVWAAPARGVPVLVPLEERDRFLVAMGLPTLLCDAHGVAWLVAEVGSDVEWPAGAQEVRETAMVRVWLEACVPPPTALAALQHDLGRYVAMAGKLELPMTAMVLECACEDVTTQPELAATLRGRMLDGARLLRDQRFPIVRNCTRAAWLRERAAVALERFIAATGQAEGGSDG